MRLSSRFSRHAKDRDPTASMRPDGVRRRRRVRAPGTELLGPGLRLWRNRDDTVGCGVKVRASTTRREGRPASGPLPLLVMAGLDPAIQPAAPDVVRRQRALWNGWPG